VGTSLIDKEFRMPLLKIELTDLEIFELRRLLKKTPLESMKQLIFSGLGLLDWAVSEREEGKKIASVDTVNNTFTEINLYEKEGKKADGN
jgi:hypothetical protein